MQVWHEELAGRSRYNWIENFNHGFPIRHSRPDFEKTLEIGAGLGEHLEYENLSPHQEKGYHCNELRENMAQSIRARFPNVKTVVADCQNVLPFSDGFFDRILAIHVLEHLNDLPGCVRELSRLIHKERGQLLVVLPTEGSPAYSLARKVSAERAWNRLFGGGYEEFYKREHINVIAEVLEELHPYFEMQKRVFFPFPFIHAELCNLVGGFRFVPRKTQNGTP